MTEIKTERLLIRDFKATDWEDLYDYFSDEQVLQYEPYKPLNKEQTIEEARRRAADPRFLAVTLGNGKVIGNLYFAKGECGSWELGYVFNRYFWGYGYATESTKALMDYVFRTQGIHRLIAMCDPQNTASWKLLDKLGMRREATKLQNVYFFKDEHGIPLWKDTYEYAILRTEYLSQMG